MIIMDRGTWANLEDRALIAQCDVDTYRASGPGGQKRNKTSSAVRLRHGPTGLIVIAEESRSQHENRVRALRRLRQALYLKLRNALTAESLNPETLAAIDDLREARGRDGRFSLGRRDIRFWPAAGVVLDVLDAVQGRVSEAAAALGVTTGNLNEFLSTDPKLWEQANQLRGRHGHPPLRS
jgi:hypothetical protein